MRRHALRTLVKAGDARALGMLGYRADAPVRLSGLDVAPARLAAGEVLEITVGLEADAACPVLVDYVLWFHRGQGAAPRRRVMKLAQAEVAPGQGLRLVKRYRVPQGATTVAVVPGPHRVEIQVNGRILGGADFDVTG